MRYNTTTKIGRWIDSYNSGNFTICFVDPLPRVRSMKNLKIAISKQK